MQVYLDPKLKIKRTEQSRDSSIESNAPYSVFTRCWSELAHGSIPKTPIVLLFYGVSVDGCTFQPNLYTYTEHTRRQPSAHTTIIIQNVIYMKEEQ